MKKKKAKKKKARITPKERGIRVFRERKYNLKAMGFDSYREYLASDLWRGIRKTVLTAQPNCNICERPANQVHHLAYRKIDLQGRDLRRLVPLCARCHLRIEFRDRDGEKLNPAQAKAKMKQMITLRRKNALSLNPHAGSAEASPPGA